MRIEKFIHSCILVESGGTRILFDPGKFSFMDGAVKADSFHDVAAIVITHPHLDHVDDQAVKMILANNANAIVLGNRAIRDLLAKSDIEVDVFESGQRTIGNCTIDALPAKHAELLNAEAPPNVAYIVDGRLLHPGDSFDHALDARNGIELLALPVMAPWTTELSVAEFAMRLAPKTVFPIHDGYAKDFFLDSRYDNYRKYFEKQGIEFVPMKEVGATLER
ncbi:MAG TPA: MBL fold metallo-hydrolase [Thermoanaerobaculia bacterium]|nr:MBL fold metallo-hydrolase [Thermoanaerobaculia bacterium]